jgi:DNA-binding CsgD family transcriptional regulator
MSEASIMDEFTARERDIAVLLASGLSQPEIAARLSLSVGTVYTYTKRIRYKAGGTTVQVALRIAREIDR